MPSIQWIQESEPAVGENHPSLSDVINRPLKQLLTNSGFSPNDPNIVLLGAIGDGINIQPTVISRISTPPAVPNNGDTYIVLPTGTGDWLGRDNNIAIWNGVTSSWSFYIPDTGWKVYSTADGFEYEFDGSVWTSDYTIGGNLVVGGNLTIDGTTHGVGAAQFDSTMTVTDETFLSDVETSGIGYFGFTKASMAPYIESGDSLWAFTRAAVIRLNNSGTLKLGRVNGAIATPTQILSGQELGVFSFRGYNTDTTAFAQTASVKGFAGSDWSGINQESFIVFITTSNGSTSSIGRWTIQSAGHFVANTDNVYDIGASGANRLRNLYLGTSGYFPVAAIFGTNPASTGYVRLPNAGYIFSRNPANTGDVQMIGVDATTNLVVGDPTNTITNINLTILTKGWTITGAGYFVPFVDNSQVIGTTAKRISEIVVASDIQIGTNPASVGPLRLANGGQMWARNAANSGDVPVIGLDGSNNIVIGGAGANSVEALNNFTPNADNSLSLGTNALRWLSGSFSSYVQIGSSVSATGALRFGNATTISWRNAANSADVVGLSVNASNSVVLGGTNVNVLAFSTSAAVSAWQVVNAGHLITPTDNTYDIGASGATRPRSLYIGTSGVFGTDPGSSAVLRIAADNTNGSIKVAGISGFLTNPDPLYLIKIANGSTHPSTGTQAFGILLDYTLPATATNTNIWFYMRMRTSASATPAGIEGLRVDFVTHGAGSAVGLSYGIHILNVGDATVTGTSAALQIDAQSGSGGNSFAIRTVGGLHQFGDVVNIISTTANQFSIANVSATQVAKFNVTSVGALELTFTGTTPNIALFAAGSYGGGKGVIFIANDTTDPASNPVGGGVLYVAAGALKWKGSGGTVTTLGPA